MFPALKFWLELSADFKTDIKPVVNPDTNNNLNKDEFQIGPDNHDTIGMIAFDQFGKSASGTSTNGNVLEFITSLIPKVYAIVLGEHMIF